MIASLWRNLTTAARPPKIDQQLGLEQPGRGLAVVQRVHDDAGGPAFGERLLLVVDEAALERETRTARPGWPGR